MDDKLTIIDTHCHIYYPDFESDWDQMLARAEENGVRGMVVVGADLASSRQAVEIAERYEQISAPWASTPMTCSRPMRQPYGNSPTGPG